MKIVEPQIFLIGETKIDHDELYKYLESIGAEDWNSNAGSDVEIITEVGGRLCYRSFKPGLNPNVTKVREGNDTYLNNVINSGHGSVFEHAQLNFILHNVSRVVTHELVRHRAGCAISQESLRYVRLDQLSTYIPECLMESEESTTLFIKNIEHLENIQKELAELYKIDEEKSFDRKKKLTSAFRRLAPIGLATSMLWSVNLRALRHIITMRTDPHAEEEIRVVFNKVWDIVSTRYPNMFQDVEIIPDGDGKLNWYKMAKI